MDDSEDHGILTVTWDPPLDADASLITGYKVEWSDGDDFSSFHEATPHWSSTYLFYYIQDLPPLATYYVRVRAVNAGGDGPPSDAVSRQVPRRPAAPVISLVVSDGEVNVEWTAPESYGGRIYAYNIEWRTGEDPPFPTLEGVNTPTYPNTEIALPSRTSHYLTGLTNGTPYQVRVFALGKGGHGDASEVATGTPAVSTLAPPAITDVTATTSSLTVAWDAAPGDPPTGYKLQWWWWVEWDYREASLTGTSHTFTGLFEDMDYQLKVKAVSGETASAWSNPYVASTHAGIPGKPRNVRVSAEGHRQLVVKWSPPNDAGASTINGDPIRATSITGYRVEWSQNADFSDSQEAILGGDLRSYAIGNLTRGVTYYVRVAASTVSGEGPWSDASNGQPLERAGAPTITRVDSGDGNLIVYWTAPSDNGGAEVEIYVLQYRSSADPPFPTNAENTGAVFPCQAVIDGS